VAAGTASTSVAYADEAQARSLLKAMSDYLAAQKAISFDYDTNLEIVSTQQQKVGLASSGTVTLNRPDKLHATRTGGFANVDMVFDGKTLTLLGKNANLYAQVEAPGTIDQLVDVLRDKYHRPVPAADLLMSDPYKELMPLVNDAKDLGSGVIRGVECDHLAFRTKDVDWQIWIAQGAQPYPCRYVITTKKVTGWPQYTLDVRRSTPMARTIKTWWLLVGLAFVILSGQASAQVDVPDTWGGDLLSRPRLTGDWGGWRDELGKKGIVFDVDLLMTPQVVTSGGRSTGGSFWGNADYTLNVDTQKLGLWPGGFFKVEADTGFGSNVFQNAGTIVPVNTAALLPAPNDNRADKRDAYPVPQPPIRCDRRQDQHVRLGGNRVLRRLPHPVSKRRIQLSDDRPTGPAVDIWRGCPRPAAR